MKNKIKQNRLQRIRRTRAQAFGTPKRPRLAVHRSNKNLNLQLIDDKSGKTIVSASTKELKAGKNTKTEQAFAVGGLLAKNDQQIQSIPMQNTALSRRLDKLNTDNLASLRQAEEATMRLPEPLRQQYLPPLVKARMLEEQNRGVV